jgi:hypothetical protein
MTRYLGSTNGTRFDAGIFKQASADLTQAVFVEGKDGISFIPSPAVLHKNLDAWIAKYKVIHSPSCNAADPLL